MPWTTRLRPTTTRLTGFLAFVFTAALVATARQPPEVEDPKGKPPGKTAPGEKEDPKGGVKKKIEVPDDPPARTGPAIPPGGNTPDVRLDVVAKAAATATHPAIRAFLSRYDVPFDRVTDSKSVSTPIRPIPVFHGHLPTSFGVQDLDAAKKPQPVRTVALKDVRRVEFFEEIVVADVDRWLKQKPLGTAGGPDGLGADDQLAAAEKVLAGALAFHDYAVINRYPGPEHTTQIRSGKQWDDVRKPLDERLRTVRIRQLQRAAAGSDWQRVRTAENTLVTHYPKDPAVAKEIGAARVAEAEQLLKSNAHTDRVKVRQLLDEYETLFPGAADEPVKRLRKLLTDEAQRLYDRAADYTKAGDLVEARNDLDRANDLDASVPGLQEMRKQLGSGHRVLYVGARVFPERMSPATARFDSEKQVVELVFEGLLEELPDGAGGVRYRPGAAAALPAVVPGGRDVVVRTSPRAANGREGLDAHDVVETVKLLRTRPDLPVSAGLPWVEGLPTPSGPAAVHFTLRHGHPDPRSLLTFKVLPGRWLADNQKKVTDPDFAARPFGTGPYGIHTLPTAGTTGVRELVLAYNPAYGRPQDRIGLPNIREIRFVEVSRIASLSNLFQEFRAGRLHVLPDLTPDELRQAVSQNGAETGGKGVVVTASTNRRVHVLAVNLRNAHLQNRDLRKGLSLAIDREEILNEVFRTIPVQYRRYTAAMTGPFPPASWATVKTPNGQPIHLVNRGEALVRLRNYLAAPGAVAELRLAYPAGDAQAEAACKKIKEHVESLMKDAPEGRKLTLILDRLDPRELRRRVDDEHRYDLAYVPFDYPDDWYPLGLASALDPAAAGLGGRNVTGFFASPGSGPEDRDLNGELAALLDFRDYSGQLVPRAARIHRLFNESVPFVPLWQLDRHTLVHSGLKVIVDDGKEPLPLQAINPTVLFHNAARWKLE